MGLKHLFDLNSNFLCQLVEVSPCLDVRPLHQHVGRSGLLDGFLEVFVEFVRLCEILRRHQKVFVELVWIVVSVDVSSERLSLLCHTDYN